MLHGQNFRRRHERHLMAVFDHDRRGFQRHNGLAAPHIALQQAAPSATGFSRSAAISASTRFLCPRRFERQDAFQRVANRRLAHAKGYTGHLLQAALPQRQAELEKEKFLEDQPLVRRRTKLVELGDVLVLRRKVRRRAALRGGKGSCIVRA